MDWSIGVSIDLINQQLLPLLLTPIEPAIAEFTVNRACSGAEVLSFLSHDGGLRALSCDATKGLSTLTNAIRRSWLRHSSLDMARSEV